MRKLLFSVVAGALVLTAALGAGKLIRHNIVQQQACQRIEALERSVRAERTERAAHGKPLVAFLGDSYTEGQHLPSAFDGFPYAATKGSGAAVMVDGIGGSGYTTSGPCKDDSLADRLPGVLRADPDVLVLQAGINDLTNGGQRRHIDETLDRVKVDGRVLVLGAFEPPAADSAQVQALNRDLRASARAHHFTFVRVDGWVTSWLPDGNHPSARGAAQIGRHLAPLLAA